MRLRTVLAIVAAVGIGAWSAQAAIINLSSTIDGAQETPDCSSGGVVPSTGTGSGTFVLDSCANTLDFNVTFTGLTCPPEQFSHIHGPAAPGANAAVLQMLPNGSPKIGTWNYPEANEADILNGLTYVNIHGTSCCSTGEIRGQILQDPGQPTPGPCPTPSLDHFTCYKAKATSGTTKFPGIPNPPGVSLVDQFGSSTVTVKKTKMLCNPTQKNAEPPPANPNEHLKTYQVKPAIKFTKVLNVSVTDQFGTRKVDVLKPAEIMLPTAKDLIAPPPPLVSPVTDHFQCYKVKDLKFPAKFQPITVTSLDQFGPLTLELKKPIKLCAPVNKNGEDPSAPTHPDHLFCYKVKDLKLPQFVAVTPIFVNNQFGPEMLDAKKPREICLPASKSVPVPTATATVTPTPVATPSATPTFQPGTIFQGAITKTSGAWNYDGVQGLPGGEIECDDHFPGSHVCTYAELQSAEGLSELDGAVDVTNLPVTSFWAVIPGDPDLEQCICSDACTTIRWFYATAHTASKGKSVPLNNGTGALGPLSGLQSCPGNMHWVGCCN